MLPDAPRRRSELTECRGGVPCDPTFKLIGPPFEVMSCPSGVEATLSETHVKRGHRVVHDEKELNEKLGRNDLCPCGSGRLFNADFRGA